MRPDSLRVLLITGADLRRGAPGGTRTYVLGLARFLANKGVSVGILSNGHPKDIPPGVTLVPISEEHLPSTVAFQGRLRKWSHRADWARFRLLHFQRPDDLDVIRNGALPPAICTLHGDAARGVRRRRGRLAGLAYLRRECNAIPRFHALVAVDDTTADEYRHRYPETAHRIVTIPVAVDDSFLERTARTSSSSRPTFLFVGRLSGEKRVDRIIEALRSPSVAETRLLVAGSGPAAARLRTLARGAAVEFLGNVPQDTLPTLYREADGLVLASEYEGLPTAALEALACGCPVVAPLGSGLDALLAEGRGVLTSDVRELSEALSSCLRLRRSRAPISLPSQYTWPSVGERILQLYRSIAPGVVP